MDTNKSTDFKSNVTALTKILPNEFEKYFQDWMERDDVARSLQAKLRCDLIKNFNKTNLGKHILSHTMTSSGGTTMRLTLSPLILALNTLVAEFLYAQNCHFTLSVFCTEIPFRNTLPDFESVGKFRFNEEEISEIWRAVSGFKANKRDLNKHIIKNYELNPNVSLLLLIIQYLLKKEPLEQLKRNAEVQTEVPQKSHKLISAQVSDHQRKSDSKVNTRDDNTFYHINKYLLTLSEKVIEMTREFEQFSKQRREPRRCSLKSSRSREYYMFNKSLERLTENMRKMAQTESQNKCLSNIIESIDNLTLQFGKCAQNFNNVTKFLGSKLNMPDTAKPGRAKVKVKEQHTETEVQAKSYNDWINEMRNTENGQTFLNRVEICLRKALTKHHEQLKKETDIKMKHLKSLMKLHYQQKLSKQLLQEPKVKFEEARKFNDDVARKLEQFERKQVELLQKLRESSLELKEVQLQQKLSVEQSLQEEVNHKEDANRNIEKNSQHTDSCHSQIYEKFAHSIENIHFEDDLKTKCKVDPLPKAITTPSPSKGVSSFQCKILDIAQNIAEEGHSVDEIIYDAKLRIQQLENESNQLERNFQSYLERRKRCQEQVNNKNEKSKIHTFLQDLHEITTDRLRLERRKTETFDKDEEQTNEELQRLRKKLQQEEPTNNTQKTAKSDTSTSSLEIKNAILEAKLKFFEHENTLRKCRELEDEMHTCSSLQKHLEKYSQLQELQYYDSETLGSFEPQTDAKEKLEPNTESSLSEINVKDKTLDEEQDIDLSPMTDHKSQKSEERIAASARKELFPKQSDIQSEDLQDYLRHETIIAPKKGPKQNLMEEKSMKRTEATSELIKHSMAKMQLLFQQQSKSQETLKEIVKELQQENVLHNEEIGTTTRLMTCSNEVFDKSLATTITSTATTTRTSADTDINTHSKISQRAISPSSHVSGSSLLNLSIGSEVCFETANLNVAEELQQEPALRKELEITIPCHEDDVDQLIDSSVSSESQLYLKSEPNAHPKLTDINFIVSRNEKEMGENVTETDPKFNIIEDKLFENFSSRSSSDLEISVGQQNTDVKNLDDSESDFWA